MFGWNKEKKVRQAQSDAMGKGNHEEVMRLIKEQCFFNQEALLYRNNREELMLHARLYKFSPRAERKFVNEHLEDEELMTVYMENVALNERNQITVVENGSPELIKTMLYNFKPSPKTCVRIVARGIAEEIEMAKVWYWAPNYRPQLYFPPR